MAFPLQQRLRNLCCHTRWCYAAFWKLQPPNDMVLLLPWEDGHCGDEIFASDSTFGLMQESENGGAPSSRVGGSPSREHINIGYEDQVTLAMAKMSDDLYSLGKEFIGHVALTGEHQWLFAPEDADSSAKGATHKGTNLEESPASFCDRFDLGVKTIAVVAVRHGVVELGSTQKMIEDIDFVRHIQALFDSHRSAATTSPPDFPPKKEVLGSLQAKSQAAPMPSLNDPQKQDVSFNCPCNCGHCVSGPNLPMARLSKKHTSPCRHHSDFSVIDEVVSSPRKFPYNCSTGGDAILISTSELSNISNASCGPPSKSLHGCKDLPKMDKNFKNTLLPPSKRVHLTWECLYLGEVETWHQNFSSDSSRVEFPHDEESCWQVEKSSPKFLNQYKQSEILAPFYVKEKERAISSTTPNERIESECGISLQSTSSVSSCSSNNFSKAASKQPKFLRKCEIKGVITENFGDLDLRSQFKLKDDPCIGELDLEPPKGHHQFVSMKSRKRSRPKEDHPRPQPKDRQIIKDRLRNLRKIVPNSTRCSIGELLERTIKHLQFLESVTCHEKKHRLASGSK